MSQRDAALRGGDRGPAIIPGKADDSLLYRVIKQTAEPHMPFGGAKLADEEIAAIAAWINNGSQWDGSVRTSAAPIQTPSVKSDHWAFRTPQQVAPPMVRSTAWVRNPIDSFIAAEHEKRGLTAVAEADKRTLLRRVYLDVIGLPPTRDEVQKFLADTSPTAYESVVDKLLADPRYGERWGRHWMDVWRYSDWYGWRKGNDVRNSQRFMWRWRDWIVESLNTNKGYDRMIVEMLAGDEVAPDDPKTLRATGFLARDYSKYDRNGWMQDAVDHTAMAFLGVTLKCARCHDHKFDPFMQEEYYRFRAFFEPYQVRVDRVPGELDTDKDGLSRVYDADLETPTYLLIRGDIQNPDKEHKLSPGVPAVLGGTLAKIAPVALPVNSYFPDHRPFVFSDLVTQAKADVEHAEAELRKQKEEYKKIHDGLSAGEDPDLIYKKLSGAAEAVDLAEKTLAAAKAYLPAVEARIAADRAKFADPPDPNYEQLADAARKAERQAGILKANESVQRAELELKQALEKQPPDEKKAAEAQKKVVDAQTALTQSAEGYTSVGTVYPTNSSGRRTALARWIASADNPLTARVAVNHIWLRHFGHGLVPTVFDFGRNGKPPSNPELLDWLANEFVRQGWNMKAIHRLILTSSAYRMRSTAGTEGSPNAAIDPENVYLWRMNPRRMEAEAVRDSVLYVAGDLDPAMGGPEIDETKGFESRRRSIYFRHSPDTQMEFLKMFDAPSPMECYVRNESVVPQQALALANSQLAEDQAQVLARRIEKFSAPSSFVTAAFETVLGRPPSAQELAAAEKFLQRQPQLVASREPVRDSGAKARADLVHVLFNHNDFVTIR